MNKENSLFIVHGRSDLCYLKCCDLDEGVVYLTHPILKQYKGFIFQSEDNRISLLNFRNGPETRASSSARERGRG